MTISNPTFQVGYTGDGSIVTYPYTNDFYVLQASDMKVFLDGILQTTGYNVTGVGQDNSGSVVFDTPPGLGVAILLVRVVPNTQLTDYEDYDPFSAEDTENAFDKLTMANINQQDEIGRSLKVAFGETDPPVFDLDGANGNVLEVTSDGSKVVGVTSAQEFRDAETNAIAAANAASVSAGEALSSENFSREWASNPEDNDVNDGINPVNFSSFHYMKKAESIVATGVQLRNGIVAGAGNLLTDFNAMDWTGTPYAVGTAFEILDNNVTQFQYDGNLYDWFGIKGITVGLGGNYTAVASDLFLSQATNAASVSFDPNLSTLSSTNVQAAIDETDVKVEANKEDIAAIVTGFKNVLINGDFRINQRGFDGNWAAAADNEYGYDRWFKAELTKIGQYIEDANVIVGDQYTVSWDNGTAGDGLGFVYDKDAVPLGSGTSGFTFTMATTGNFLPAISLYVPNDATNIQLERGTVQTDFEIRNIQQELAMCQRLYWEANGLNMPMSLVSTTSTNRILWVPFPVTMRVPPTSVTYTVNAGTPSPAGTITIHGFRALVARGDTTSSSNILSIKASAEL